MTDPRLFRRVGCDVMGLSIRLQGEAQADVRQRMTCLKREGQRAVHSTETGGVSPIGVVTGLQARRHSARPDPLHTDLTPQEARQADSPRAATATWPAASGLAGLAGRPGGAERHRARHPIAGAGTPRPRNVSGSVRRSIAFSVEYGNRLDMLNSAWCGPGLGSTDFRSINC